MSVENYIKFVIALLDNVDNEHIEFGLKLEIEGNPDSQLFSQVVHPLVLNDVCQIIHIVSSAGLLSQCRNCSRNPGLSWPR